MPFLIADPYPSSGLQPTTFRVYMDGATTPVDSVPVTNGDGSKQMHYDLTSLPVGSHTVQASAAIIDVWGTSESVKAPIVPLVLQKRDVAVKPGVLTGLGLAAS